MEFGKTFETELNGLDLRLPPDPSFNRATLQGSPAGSPKLYVGCAKWGIPEWVGRIYPPGTREKQYLDHYLRLFNSVELNATHYKIIGPAGISRWAGKAGEREFLFCPKMYQAITHKGKLAQKKFLTAEFLRGIAAFGNHLGPVLIQFSEGFSIRRKEELFNWLGSLPKGFQFQVELRHSSWFDPKHMEWTGLLRKLKMGAVITDVAGRRDAAHMHLPVPSAFVRFAGNNLHPTDYTRIDDWIKRISSWLAAGLEELYFFVHMNDETYSPELAIYLVDRLNAATGLHLPHPVLINNKKKGE